MTWKKVYKKRFVGIAIAANLVFGLLNSATAQEASEITGTGTAEIKGSNFALARTAAIKNAMSEALVQLSSKWMTPSAHARVQDILLERLTPAAESFVRDYKILSEKREKEEVHVEIQFVAREKELQDELAKNGFIFDRGERPRFVLHVAGNTPEAKKWTANLRRRLTDLGYEVRNSAEAEKDLVSLSGSLMVSGKVLVGTFQYRVGSEAGGVKSRHELKDTPATAAGLMATDILRAVLPPWTRSHGQGATYEVVVEGLRAFAPYLELKEFLNSGRLGFVSATEHSFAKGRIVLAVSYDGSGQNVVDTLSKFQISGKKLEIRSVEGRQIHIVVR